MKQVTSTVIALREAIRCSYQPGDQLPNEQALAVEIGVSRATLREAVTNLVAEGLLQKRWGVGTFVLKADSDDAFGMLAFRPGIPKSLEATGGVVTLTHVAHRLDDPDPKLFPDFPAAPIAKLTRVYALDGAGVILVRDRLVTEHDGLRVDFGTRDWLVETIPDLYERIGLHFDALALRLRAVLLTSEEQQLFGAPEAEPAIGTEGIAVDDRQRIIVRLGSVIRTSIAPATVSSGPMSIRF